MVLVFSDGFACCDAPGPCEFWQNHWQHALKLEKDRANGIKSGCEGTAHGCEIGDQTQKRAGAPTKICREQDK